MKRWFPFRFTRDRSARGGAFQVGALPYRKRKQEVEIMLITSRGGNRWIVPKGWPMVGKTLPEAAAIEAYEEAGVRGVIGEREIGRFMHRKTGWLGGGPKFNVAVYPLDTRVELEDWPERGQRQRRWFTIDEALAAIQSDRLRNLVAAAGDTL